MSLVEDVLHNGFLYDVVQYAVGADLIRRHLRPELQDVGRGIVTDLGAGTGLYASCVPASARYVWYDNDPVKLRRFQVRRRSKPAVLGDATRLAFRDKSVDWTLCVNLTHHLSDDELERLLGELHRVTRRRIVVHDPLDADAWMSRVLWRHDRGSHPRTRAALLDAVSGRFTVHRVVEFSRFHRYLLVVAEPR